VQRARSSENRALRRAEILAAAAALFDAGTDFSLDAVAKASGLTRTTLYGYASTREELLLHLVDAELSGWFTDIAPGIRRSRTPAGIARVLTQNVVARPRLAPLLTHCGIVFERNVSLAAVTQWKLRVHEQLMSTGQLIDHAVGTKTGSGARLLLHTHASVVGLHSLATPPPIAAKAIADSGIEGLTINFERELQLAVHSLAETILAKPKDLS
jgi:AcrR family transcriptional regulator